jgi:hypothetical protein
VGPVVVVLVFSHLAATVGAYIAMVLNTSVMLHLYLLVTAVTNDYKFTHFKSPRYYFLVKISVWFFGYTVHKVGIK